MIVDIIRNDYEVSGYMRMPRGRCLNCAKRVAALLINNNIRFRVIGLLFWKGLSDRTPANHYAVVACVENRYIVIDPTAGQFPGWQPFFGVYDDWIAGLRARLPFRVIKGCAYNSVQEAEIQIGQIIFSSALDFDGVLLQKPAWYERMANNAMAFRRLEARTFERRRRSLSALFSRNFSLF